MNWKVSSAAAVSVGRAMTKSAHIVSTDDDILVGPIGLWGDGPNVIHGIHFHGLKNPDCVRSVPGQLGADQLTTFT